MIILLKNKSNNLVLWDVRRSTRSDYINGNFTKEYRTNLNVYGFSCLGYTEILELSNKEELNDYPEFFL